MRMVSYSATVTNMEHKKLMHATTYLTMAARQEQLQKCFTEQ